MSQVNREHYYQEELELQRASELPKKLIDGVKKIKIFEDINKAERSKVTMLTRFILVLAIIADIFGLIPVVGGFLGIFFGAIITTLYVFDGVGRGVLSRTTKKFLSRQIVKIIILTLEFSPFSFLPLFTIQALVHIYLLKKGYYAKLAKVDKKIEQIKKL